MQIHNGKPTYSLIVTLDVILPKIEAALASHKISATRFGYIVAGDPALVTKMRDGRHVRVPMRKKIEAALTRIEQKGSL